MKLIEVFIPYENLKINTTFTYLYDLEPEIKNYTRVIVNFNNKKMMAFVVNVLNTDKNQKELEIEYGFNLSYVLDIIDKESILNSEQIQISKWLSKSTISPYITCLNVLLPKYKKTIKKDKVKKNKNNFLIKKEILTNQKLTKKQIEIYNKIQDNTSYFELKKNYRKTIDKFIELNLLSKVEYVNKKEIYHNNFKQLSLAQKNAYNEILTNDKMVNLLFGVTGSGKTEVFLHLSKHYIENNKQVLLLVPEITLTAQMIERVKSRFNRVSVYHSFLSDEEKYNEYTKILNKEIDIVVGTRSSIFLPFDNIGLIILDEEHDSSYIQENTPAYNTKDVAIKRGIYHQSKVVFASATPNLKTYAKAINKEYGLIELKERINQKKPLITIVDKNNEKDKSLIFTSYLRQRINEELLKGNQIILLLNRRGYFPYLKCGLCNKIRNCNDCEISLSYHQDEDALICHNCTKKYPKDIVCSNCGGISYIYYSYGTKKVEEQCKKIFSNYKVARFDRDSVKNNYEVILKQFENKEIDILIGTQMIAKGLDYPLVSLVGIIDGDQGMMRDDYMSAEEKFSLLMQASGRSGRGNVAGEVIIQTYNKDNFIIQAVEKQSYLSFFKEEIEFRKNMNHPPFNNIIVIDLKDSNENRLDNSISNLKELFKKYYLENVGYYKLPTLKNVKRVRFILSNKKLIELLKIIENIVNEYLENRKNSDILVNTNIKRL